MQDRRRVSDLRLGALLRDVVEEGQQSIEFLLRDRVELVVMAASTTRGQAQPDGRSGLKAIDHVVNAILFVDDAGFHRRHVIPTESCGDSLVGGWVGQQVTSQLLDGELIKGHIAIEGVDDPVTPSPHRPFAVPEEAVGIGKPRRIEPVSCQVLAKRLGVEQSIDDLQIGVRRFVGEIIIELLRRRRKPRQVKRHSTQQNAAIRFR